MILQADGVSRVVGLLRFREVAAAATDGVTALLGLVLPRAAVDQFVAAVHLPDLIRATLNTVVLVAILLTVIYLLEVINKADRTSYFSKTFVQDLMYALFYQGGFYAILIWAAIANALGPRLDFLKIEVLAGLPGPVHWILYWIVVDFITYWWHRMLHTWGPLWAFHSVHHSQEKMSFISSYRLHPFEQLGQNLIMVVPLLVLGVPTFRWLPLYAAMNVFEAAQHSALSWGFGRGYFVFVSPRFHSVHHSTDPKHHNRNYAKILSLWDFMFGTGVYEAHRPERLGVEGLPIPGSIRAQLAAPFRILAHQRGVGEGPGVTAVAPPEPRSNP
jgi:sterol desaturase/sphingolipid hydroxylase (fatty acid hydroxylase superfamily)